MHIRRESFATRIKSLIAGRPISQLVILVFCWLLWLLVPITRILITRSGWNWLPILVGFPRDILLFMASANYFSPKIFPCSSARQLSFPAFPRRDPSTFDSRQYITKYGPIRCSLGLVGNHHSTCSDDGIAYRKKHYALAGVRAD